MKPGEGARLYRTLRVRRSSRTALVESLGQARADRELLRILDEDSEEAARRAGSWLRCEAGCSDCCHGPFPVTRLDAWRLRRGLAALDGRDAELATAIRRRARQAVATLGEGFPGELSTGQLSRDEMLLDRFFERHGSLACPALDNRSGRCELYEWRPVSCRTYGPPLRFDDRGSPPCDLCFRGASSEVVERCRIVPDRDGLETAILASMGVSADEPWVTLIAFALLADG
jgi:Fe-S-cluster containining protein